MNSNYVIAHDRDPLLYWSNDQGWVDYNSASIFTVPERDYLNLPDEGKWVFDYPHHVVETVGSAYDCSNEMPYAVTEEDGMVAALTTTVDRAVKIRDLLRMEWLRENMPEAHRTIVRTAGKED